MRYTLFFQNTFPFSGYRFGENRFTETDTGVHVDHNSGENPRSEEVLIKVPNATVHLIDERQSIEGKLMIVRLRQGDSIVAVKLRVGDEFRWSLVKEDKAVKLNGYDYFFSRHVLENELEEGVNFVKYGLTVKGEGEEKVVDELDVILENYSWFSVKEVKGEVIWEQVAKEEVMDRNLGGHWVAMAPNVDDYSGTVSKMIAAASRQVIKGIFWCGDFTVGVMKLRDFIRKRMGPQSDTGIVPQTLRRS